MVELDEGGKVMARPIDVDNLTMFRREMLEYMCSHHLNASQFLRLSGFPVYRSSWLTAIISGGVTPKAETMLLFRRVMNQNPDAIMPQSPVAAAPPPECADDTPPNIRVQMEIAAKRDAAAAARAAWIEQQRQAELTKYGFTTIGRDVMEMAA